MKLEKSNKFNEYMFIYPYCKLTKKDDCVEIVP